MRLDRHAAEEVDPDGPQEANSEVSPARTAVLGGSAERSARPADRSTQPRVSRSTVVVTSGVG
ncbi:hypothetical protein GCM10010266_69910 [Streptomyces griseomycini]|nr:hypothetical protein GCM10010266_69910 [Streptomyces griseomycini]GGR50925.1 hypothetical protein GCM10015536_65660 [Streptomyces griseomycini]